MHADIWATVRAPKPSQKNVVQACKVLPSCLLWQALMQGKDLIQWPK